MKTIAKQLNVTEFPFIIKDKNGNEIYFESSDGYWCKREFDSNGNELYYENSDGFWSKIEYDSNGKVIYYGNSVGYWSKHEYDSNGNKVYYENSSGIIIGNRKIPEYTMEELSKKLGFNFKLKKINENFFN